MMIKLTRVVIVDKLEKAKEKLERNFYKALMAYKRHYNIKTVKEDIIKLNVEEMCKIINETEFNNNLTNKDIEVLTKNILTEVTENKNYNLNYD